MARDRSGLKGSSPPGLALIALVPLGFLAIFFVWPVVAIIRLGLREGGVLATLGNAEVWGLVAFTVGQAAAATVVAVVAGLPVAFLLARTSLPGLGFVRVVILVPFVLPSVVVGLAFRTLLPAGGVLAIILANAFFNVAVVARTVAGLWAHLDRRAEDAARALGASRVRTFTSVVLPALAPAIGSAAAVVFLFCATSFGVVLILGGARLRTLETEIYLRTVELLDLSGAAALSLLQLGAVVAALSIGAVARRRRETALRLRGHVETARRPTGGEWAVVAVAIAVVGALLVPIAVLVARSLSTGFAGYRALAGTGHAGSLQVSGVDAVVNSLRAATDATVLAVTLGVLACVVLVSLSRSRVRRGLVETMDTVLMLPLGVSAVTVGFGYLITLDLLPGDLRTSPALVPLAQALVVTPLVIRILLPVLRSIDERLRQAAASLGAGPWRVVPLGVRSRRSHPAPPGSYLLAVGRDHRDWRTLAAAARHSDLEVVVTGPSKLPVDVDLPLVRTNSPQEYYELVERSTAVVVPLIDGDRPAGLLTFLDAFSLGRPVVATAGSGTKDYITPDRGILVPAGDPSALRSAMEQLRDPSVSSRMGAAALEATKDELSLQRFVEAIDTLAREVHN